MDECEIIDFGSTGGIVPKGSIKMSTETVSCPICKKDMYVNSWRWWCSDPACKGIIMVFNPNPNLYTLFENGGGI